MPSHFANSYPRRSDWVAILVDEIFITAAASLGKESTSAGWLKKAKKTTPPEFTVTYMNIIEERIEQVDNKYQIQVSLDTKMRDNASNISSQFHLNESNSHSTFCRESI